jgi:hypothetical protein
MALLSEFQFNSRTEISCHQKNLDVLFVPNDVFRS